MTAGAGWRSASMRPDTPRDGAGRPQLAENTTDCRAHERAPSSTVTISSTSPPVWRPHGDIASLDQHSVVCRPIPDVVFCFVLWVHSRLHVEIMHLLSPRGPGGRSWLTEGAGSVHQRRAPGTLARIRLRAAVRRQSWRKRVGTPAAWGARQRGGRTTTSAMNGVLLSHIGLYGPASLDA